MRFELTGDLPLFIETLNALAYPHPWPSEFMAACIKAFIRDNDDHLAGAAFFHHGPVPGHIYGHLAIAPGKIIDRNGIGDFHKVAELMGGTQLRLATQEAPPEVITMTERLGWVPVDDGAAYAIGLNPCIWTGYQVGRQQKRRAA